MCFDGVAENVTWEARKWKGDLADTQLDVLARQFIRISGQRHGKSSDKLYSPPPVHVKYCYTLRPTNVRNHPAIL